MERHHQPSGTEAELEGLVEMLPVAAGSKSQHTRPVLRLDGDRYAQVHVEGDPYFDAPTLQGLLDRRIRIAGRWDSLILRVSADDIVELTDEDEDISAPDAEEPEVTAETPEDASNGD